MNTHFLCVLSVLQAAATIACAAEIKPVDNAERLRLIENITGILRDGGDLNAKDQYGRPTVYLAALAQDPKIVKLLLDGGVDVDAADNDGYTALHVAALNNTPAVAGLLIEHGANINAANTEGRSPLYIAAREGCLEMVQLLLERGADPMQTKEGGWTCMHVAASQNKIEVLEELRKAGLSPNIRNAVNGWTPLHAAALDGQLENCRYLVEQGADIDAFTRCHCTPLLYAAENGHGEIVEYLCTRGADPQVRNCKGYTPLLLAVERNFLNSVSVLLDHGAEIAALTYPGDSVIHLATKNNNVSMIGLLISRGADPSAPNGEGHPPIYAYVNASSQFESVQPQTLDALIQQGSNVNMPSLYDLWDPLYRASRTESTDNIALLKKHKIVYNPYHIEPPAFVPASFIKEDRWGKPSVDYSANLDTFLADHLAKNPTSGSIDEAGNTVLHWLAENSFNKGIEVSIKTGESVNVRNGLGQTPLIRAAKIAYNQATLELLIQSGADIEAADFIGNRAMHYAAFKGGPRHVGVLLAHNAKTDAPNRFGVTPLHYALMDPSSNGRESAAKLLAEGASVTAVDYASQTPLHVVCQNSFEMLDVIETMILSGANVNQKNYAGKTPLHMACRSERTMSVLLKHGANINAMDYQGLTPLSECIRNTTGNTVEFMLTAGASPQLQTYSSGFTALHYAANKNSPKLLKLLLDHGADPMVRNTNDQTALEHARQYKRTAAIQFLEALQPPVDLKSAAGASDVAANTTTPQAAPAPSTTRKQTRQEQLDITRGEWLYWNPGPLCRAVIESDAEKVVQAIQNGAAFDEHFMTNKNTNAYTPLHCAVYFDDAEMVKLLVSHGADLNIARPDNGDRPLHTAAMQRSPAMTALLADLGADLRAVNKGDYTAYHQAVICGATEVITYYLQHGFDINEKDIRGQTALHIAAYNHGPVEFLLSKGADVNAQDTGGQTPLHRAVSLYEKKETLDLLLKAGANINAMATQGRTPLVNALESGNFKNAEYLIQAGADATIGEGHAGRKPLFLAGGNLDIALMLLEHGADINATDQMGRSIIHVLAERSNAGAYDREAMDFYLQQGASLEAVDRTGQTPIFLAIGSKRYDLIKLFAEKGANLNAENRAGNTPLEFAYYRSDTTAMKLLLQLGAAANLEDENKRKTRGRIAGKPSFEEVIQQLRRQ